MKKTLPVLAVFTFVLGGSMKKVICSYYVTLCNDLVLYKKSSGSYNYFSKGK